MIFTWGHNFAHDKLSTIYLKHRWHNHGEEFQDVNCPPLFETSHQSSCLSTFPLWSLSLQRHYERPKDLSYTWHWLLIRQPPLSAESLLWRCDTHYRQLKDLNGDCAFTEILFRVAFNLGIISTQLVYIVYACGATSHPLNMEESWNGSHNLTIKIQCFCATASHHECPL